MLDISGFKKSYNNHLVLDIPHILFPKGIHWVKGINGSGKTTLFRSIAGLIPFEGNIVLHGNINGKEHPVTYRKKINYGEAEPVYPDYLSGKDLIQFVANAKGADKLQIDFLIEALQIGSFISQPTGTYSSGMLKKLSIVLAFLGAPELIILDEPLTTVDTSAVKNIFELIMNYKNLYKTNFLISSHQLFEQTDLTITHQYLVQDQTIKLLV